MKVLLHWVDGAYERVRVAGAAGTQLDGLSMPYVSRRLISQLAHALILPPTNIGYEGHATSVPEAKLSGTVSKPSAWMVAGHLISPAQYHRAFTALSADDRYEVDRWLSGAKKQFVVGDEDAAQFVRDRLGSASWEDIYAQALEQGGLRTRWKTDPLFRRHAVTPAGLAFWRLAVQLSLVG